MKLKFLLLFSLMLCLRLTQAQKVVDIIVNSPDHNTLEAAVGAAGLVNTLNGTGPFTVFAPTDAAFAALPAGTVEALLQDPQGALTKILLNHVSGGNIKSTDLSNGQNIITFNNGKTVKVNINSNGVFINNAKVTVADIVAENGVVHVIDAVLLPPNTVTDVIIGSVNHNTLEAAVVAAGLVNTLNGAGPFTVFAPTDAAFAALPAGTVQTLLQDPQGALTKILLNHVSGSNTKSTDLTNGQNIVTLNSGKTVIVTIDTTGVYINNAKVTVADVLADNGVVHVIDAVLLPPTTVTDIIINSADHNTLEAAVGAAGLINTLNGAGPFTVFAPTDAAFAALPAGTVEALLNDIPTLTSILKYHVVGAKALSTDLSNGQKIKTLNGEDIFVTINSSGVFINDVKVTVANIETDNGVVHVVEGVIMPVVETTTVVDIIVNSPNHNTLEAAVGAAGLVGTLSGNGPFTVFAPTDAAFAALPAGTVDALLNDLPALTAILTYHVVGAKALSSDLSNNQKLKTLNGAEVIVEINANGVFINDAKVTVADILADNGVVHVIDAVLLPSSPVTVYDVIANSPDHNTLEVAVNAAGLKEALTEDGPYMVFAPTDAAFAALPAGTIDALLADPQGALKQILLYHTTNEEISSEDIVDLYSEFPYIQMLNNKTTTIKITGDGIFINNAKVTIADIIADNGIVHVIDAVLLAPDSTIIDVVRSSSAHTILETLLDKAEFSEPLEGYGPFTLFAPTDAAISLLPADLVQQLLNNSSLLEDVLAYHLVGGQALSTDLSDGQVIETLLGKNIKITINTNGVFINNAKVIIADIKTQNGVVHVLDAVLLPKTTVIDIINNSNDHTILSAVLFSTGLDEALSNDGPFTIFAPTDEAFEAIPPAVLDDILDDEALLKSILTYHAVGAKALSTSLADGQEIKTLNGSNVKVKINANGVFINDAKVTVADILADNGVVHVIDAVLLPPPSSTFDINSDNVYDLYPNPTNTAFRVESTDPSFIPSRVELFDNTGRSVLNVNNSDYNINISHLQSGIYQVNIYTDKKVTVKRLVKI